MSSVAEFVPALMTENPDCETVVVIKPSSETIEPPDKSEMSNRVSGILNLVTLWRRFVQRYLLNSAPYADKTSQNEILLISIWAYLKVYLKFLRVLTEVEKELAQGNFMTQIRRDNTTRKIN
ncbi:hypothetical protein RB2150_16724 [Rhodobacterales bacterium HTCC2150]|nr:hypothetical protein RB2150_16724 [Rhodobacterales bacterium HTCC2150] [Rhodobacteraceae bacterium HTCC2150]